MINRICFDYIKVLKKLKLSNTMLGNFPLLILNSNSTPNIEQSLMYLNQLNTNNGGSSFGKNEVYKDKKYDVQIIIAAYNAEKTIFNCLSSIFKQKTVYSYIVKVINDGSTDNTLSIVNKFKQKYKNLRVINQKNKGFSGARNTGLKEILGKYILFVDSDDTLPSNALQYLVSNAMKTNADIIEGGYNLFSPDRKREVRFLHNNLVSSDPYNDITGFGAGKLIKAQLFRNVIFPNNYWYEDTVYMYRIYPNVKLVQTLSEITYNYRMNPHGITNLSKGKNKSIDTIWITMTLLNDYLKENLSISHEIYDFTLFQFIVNTQRLVSMSEKVNKANFVISCNIIKKYFSNFSTKNPKLYILEKALRDQDYRLFIISAYKADLLSGDNIVKIIR